jgi:hypothetical protein
VDVGGLTARTYPVRHYTSCQGDTIMTMIREMPVQCPDCGKESSAVIYETINVSLDSTLKVRLLSGELLRWQCGVCGLRRLNAYPILYHDMVHAILIQWISAPYAPTLESLVAVLPSQAECRQFKALRSDYRFRVVREFDDLVEKIRIFEAGLDDRAIEWEKCLYSKLGAAEDTDQSSDDSGMELEFVQPRFRRCLEANGKRQMEFSGPAVMKLPGLPPVPLTLAGPDSLYQRVVQHLDTHLPWPKPIGGDFLLVDQGYVKRVWSKLPDISERREGHDPASPEPPQPSQATNPKPGKPWWKFW